MKYQPAESPSKPVPAADALKRRGVLVGAGGAVAAGVAASVAGRALQGTAPQAVPATPVASAGDGYQLSKHVLRYYETARV